MNDLVVRTLIQYYWTLFSAEQIAGEHYCITPRQEKYWERRGAKLRTELDAFGLNFRMAITAQAAAAYRGPIPIAASDRSRRQPVLRSIPGHGLPLLKRFNI